MNGSYYKNAMYNSDFDHIRPADNFNNNDELPMEQSYVENILRMNISKKGKFSHGEVGLPMTDSKLILPCGIYGRWESAGK